MIDLKPFENCNPAAAVIFLTPCGAAEAGAFANAARYNLRC